MRVACLLVSPVPYNTPILNALARRVDLHAIYLGKEDPVSRFVDTWGEEPLYPHSFFPSTSLHSELIDLQVQLTIGISRRLAKLDPDVVLVISWKPVVIEPVLWARCTGRRVVMWSESTSFSGLLRGRVSTELRRAIVRNSDSFVANGSEATNFLRQLGAPADRIVTSRLPGATPVPPSASQSAGAEGIRFLYVGRLIPRKRPVELIEAFEKVGREAPDATLTIVGRGELEAEVRELASRVPRVRYVGFAEGDELASCYAEADVLVLPALREVWGLVVNEALAHGLFVIATDEVGSAYDLLGEQSGVMIPADDLERLARAMIDVAGALDVSDAARVRRAATVAGCTPEQFAADIQEAVEIALRVPRSRARRFRRG